MLEARSVILSSQGTGSKTFQELLLTCSDIDARCCGGSDVLLSQTPCRRIYKNVLKRILAPMLRTVLNADRTLFVVNEYSTPLPALATTS